MKVLTANEANGWCAERSIPVLGTDQVKMRGSPRVLEGKTPMRIDRLLGLAGCLIAFEREREFAGGLIWLTEWDLEDNPLPRKLIERFRVSLRCSRLAH